MMTGGYVWEIYQSVLDRKEEVSKLNKLPVIRDINSGDLTYNMVMIVNNNLFIILESC